MARGLGRTRDRRLLYLATGHNTKPLVSGLSGWAEPPCPARKGGRPRGGSRWGSVGAGAARGLGRPAFGVPSRSVALTRLRTARTGRGRHLLRSPVGVLPTPGTLGGSAAG